MSEPIQSELLSLGELKKTETAFLLSETAKAKCDSPSKLETSLVPGSIRVLGEGTGRSLVASFSVRNLTNSPQTLCILKYTYSPSDPIIRLELEEKKSPNSKLVRRPLRHGSGFGPAFYPDSREDRIVRVTYTLPPRSGVSLDGRSEPLSNYEVSNPGQVNVQWDGRFPPFPRGAFPWIWEN